MPYATRQQLADFLQGEEGASVASLPPDADRLLVRASELVQDSTVTAVYDVDSTGSPTGPNTASAFRDATCAQVEYWLAGDEEDDILGPTAGLSVGGQSQDFGAAQYRTTPMYLAPRAARFLRLAGLLDGSVYSL